MLARLNDLPVESPQVQQSRQEILLAIEAELEPNASLHWKQFLTLGIIDRTPMKIIRRLCIYFWLPMTREWTGSSLMAYYASVILAGVGAKSSLVAVLSGVLTIFFAAGCVPLYFTIERVGRRAVLMYGAMAMSVLMLIFTALQAVSDGHSGIQWPSIGVIFVFLFTMGYAWEGCIAPRLRLSSIDISAVPQQLLESG